MCTSDSSATISSCSVEECPATISSSEDKVGEEDACSGGSLGKGATVSGAGGCANGSAAVDRDVARSGGTKSKGAPTTRDSASEVKSLAIDASNGGDGAGGGPQRRPGGKGGGGGTMTRARRQVGQEARIRSHSKRQPGWK